VALIGIVFFALGVLFVVQGTGFAWLFIVVGVAFVVVALRLRSQRRLDEHETD
jgi:Flp pilus assembly protein TadB